MHLQESGEMYLETIYVLSKNGVVRSLDVAEYMGFSNARVVIKEYCNHYNMPCACRYRGTDYIQSCQG